MTQDVPSDSMVVGKTPYKSEVLQVEVQVLAKHDIITAGGLYIADTGATGVAFGDTAPTQAQNIGRVAVQWAGKSRIYWVDAEDLVVPDGLDPEDLVSQPSSKVCLSLPKYPPSSFHFGTSLRMFRKARGLGQSALADKMGGTTGQTTISFWERKAHCPSGEFIKAVANALDVPPFFFLVSNSDADESEQEQFMENLCESISDGLECLQRLRSQVCG